MTSYVRKPRSGGGVEDSAAPGPAVTIHRRSQLNAASAILPKCARMTLTSCSVCVFQIRTSPSRPVVSIRSPSAEKATVVDAVAVSPENRDWAAVASDANG